MSVRPTKSFPFMFSIYLDDDYGVARVVAADRLLSADSR